jgi:molybdate transport system ATP-binding protein
VRARGAAGAVLLDWRGIVLEVAHAPAVSPNERVAWTIPLSGVVLHRRDRPSRGEHENPVFGIVEECLTLGDDTSIGIRLESNGALLSLRLPTHVARRNGVTVGVRAGASLLADAIHLMPWRNPASDA